MTESLEGFEILRPAHSLDVTKIDGFRQALDRALKKRPRGIILDCKKVDMIDSAGLGVLVQSMKKLRQNSGRFVLVNLNKNVSNLFQITRLYKHFDIYQDLQEFARKNGEKTGGRPHAGQ